MIQPKLFLENFYLLEEERVRQFLLTGQGHALLIDTGFPDSRVAQAVRALTCDPVTVLLTHGDGDHTGGLRDFGACWLHPGDWEMVDPAVRCRPLREGNVFSCGGYQLEVIEIPGHTYGSVALLDRAHRLLLPGDSVQVGPIFLFGPHRDLPRYIRSLEKLLALRDQVDTILPCHNACPLDGSYLETDLADAQALARGELTGVPHPDFPCQVYQGKWTAFYYDPAGGGGAGD